MERALQNSVSQSNLRHRMLKRGTERGVPGIELLRDGAREADEQVQILSQVVIYLKEHGIHDEPFNREVDGKSHSAAGAEEKSM